MELFPSLSLAGSLGAGVGAEWDLALQLPSVLPMKQEDEEAQEAPPAKKRYTGRQERKTKYKQKVAAKRAEEEARLEATKLAVAEARRERARLDAEHCALQAAQLYQEQALQVAQCACVVTAAADQAQEQLLMMMQQRQQEQQGESAAAAEWAGVQIISMADQSGVLNNASSGSSGDGTASAAPVPSADMQNAGTATGPRGQAAGHGNLGRTASVNAAEQPNTPAAASVPAPTSAAAPAAAGFAPAVAVAPTTVLPSPPAFSAPPSSSGGGTQDRQLQPSLLLSAQAMLTHMAIDAVAAGSIVPSDWQLRHIARLLTYDDLQLRERLSKETCLSLLQQWDVNPSGRHAVESKLQRLISVRSRVMRNLATHNWELMAQTFLRKMPPHSAFASPPPQAEAILRRLAGDARVVGRLTAIHDLYLGRISACRQRSSAELEALRCGMLGSMDAWDKKKDSGPLASLMAAYPELVASGGGVTAMAQAEILALVELTVSMMETVSVVDYTRLASLYHPNAVDPGEVCGTILRYAAEARQQQQLGGDCAHLMAASATAASC